MKLSFSTLGCVERSLDEVLTLAEAFSCSGVELRGLGGKIKNREIDAFRKENLAHTKRVMEDRGIAPVVLGTSAAFHSEEKYEAAITEAKEAVDIAARLGIPYIRVFGNKLLGEESACYARVIGGIRTVCRYAEAKKVGVLLEVHGDYITAARLSPITDALSAEKAFGLIWDVAHSHRGEGCDFLPFYRAMRGYIRHVHLKDVRDSDGALVLPGEGDIPIREIAETLLLDGYDGYFSLEWEKQWHPDLDAIESALAALHRCLDGLDEDRRK